MTAPPASRDQQDQHRPAPPPGSELVRHEEQHRAHQASPPSGSARQCRAGSAAMSRAGLRPPEPSVGIPALTLQGGRAGGAGAAGTTTAVVLTPFAAGRKPWPNGRQCSWSVGGMALAAGWMFFRAELRRRWRAWLALALIVGAFAGVVEAAAAGARRTDAAYPSLQAWSDAPDLLLFSFPGTSRDVRPVLSAGSGGRSAGARSPRSWPATRWRHRPRRRSSRRRARWCPAGSGAAGSCPAACLTRPGRMR